jgi:arylsulfatase A-like enzyme/Tfp pilus assembly protein PilF
MIRSAGRWPAGARAPSWRRQVAGVPAGRLPALLFAILLATCHSHVTADKPDIILVTIDTLRYDALSPQRTPFLESLAAKGTLFTNAHAHNVVTLPSHVNILTGLYPYQHGVRDNAGFVLDPKFPTVATMLRPAGYATGAFIGAFPLDARFGLNQGFDVYDDNYGKSSGSLDFKLPERPAGAVLAAAEAWWRGAEGKKRFLWVHLYDPHAPYEPPEPFASQYRDQPYYGEVAAVDAALAKTLGPILAASKNVLIIVTGDHGEALGEHGELTHGLFAYEPTLHVPLIVAGAGIDHRVDNNFVRHIDIVPTILARAGVTKPAALQGRSLFDAAPRDTYFESLSASLNRGWAPLTGIIHAGEKFIELPIAELYDLPKDPAEQHNLRDDQRRAVAEARKLLAGALIAPAQRGPLSSEETARLRSLGYVAGTAPAQASYTAADDPKTLIGLDQKLHDIVDASERHDLARALQLGREVVAERPNMAAGRELYAYALQQSEQVSEAIAQLRYIVEQLHGDDATRARLALLLTESGHAADAVKLLGPIAATSRDPDVLNGYGIALADEGKLDDANAVFNRVLAIDRNNAPALQNLGIVSLRRGEVETAQNELLHALALNPRLPLALNTLGVVYARQGDDAHAVEMWNRAVDADPRQYDALFNIGLVEGRAGHREQARAALQRFVGTAPAARYAADIATAKQALQALQ